MFEDRKQAKYLLSPTHEEEITSLVASTTKSYKELPIRLYQISKPPAGKVTIAKSIQLVSSEMNFALGMVYYGLGNSS